MAILYLYARPKRLRRFPLDPRLDPSAGVVRVINDEAGFHRAVAFRTLKLSVTHPVVLRH